jgi:hypothetical protein
MIAIAAESNNKIKVPLIQKHEHIFVTGLNCHKILGK